MSEIPEATLPQLQSWLSSGQLSAVELTRFYLERIERLNPRLHAVIEVNPQALELAQQLDEQRRVGQARGPLHGLPILLKDNIATADGLHTSAGSLALAQSVAPRDAFLVQQLRQAGALILGKANMTEWANFMSVNMNNGYSSRGGQTVNPYGPDLDTGGSSSGSGVAAAANLAAATVGTETSGSILSPASNNGVVGLKPTVGLISRTGVIPISATQDTAGPMGRHVADVAALLGGMVGVDAADGASRASQGRFQNSYLESLDPQALRGARLGIPRRAFFESLDSGVAQLMEGALEVLRAQGAKLIDPADLPQADQVFQLDWSVLLYEFRRDLNRYLATLGPQAPVRNLRELIRYNEQNPQTMLRYGQVMLLAAQSAGGVSSPAYKLARQRDLEVARDGLRQVFRQHRLDALIFPQYWGASVGAKPGYPSLVVPAGQTAEGLPVGLTLLGKPWSEARLLALGYSFEQAARARPIPRL